MPIFFKNHNIICSKLRLVDVSYFSHKTWSLADFEFAIAKQIENAHRVLMSSYFNDIQNIFMQGNKKGRLPDPAKKKVMESFYNCVANIMAYQLQTLCLNSLYEYTYYLCDYGYTNRGFEINVVMRNKQLTFEPSFNKFSEALLGIYDKMIKAVGTIPRLETRLYLDYQGEQVCIKVI